jgi:hypothetical protein
VDPSYAIDDLQLRAAARRDARRLRAALQRGALHPSDVQLAAVWGDPAASAHPHADVPDALPGPPDLPTVIATLEESCWLGAPGTAALAAVAAARLAVGEPELLDPLYGWLAGARRDPPPRSCRHAGRLVRLASEAVSLLGDTSAPPSAVAVVARDAVRAAVAHAGSGILAALRREVVRACLRKHERGIIVV